MLPTVAADPNRHKSPLLVPVLSATVLVLVLEAMFFENENARTSTIFFCALLQLDDEDCEYNLRKDLALAETT
jgi:hypothetical protein